MPSENTIKSLPLLKQKHICFKFGLKVEPKVRLYLIKMKMVYPLVSHVCLPFFSLKGGVRFNYGEAIWDSGVPCSGGDIRVMSQYGAVTIHLNDYIQCLTLYFVSYKTSTNQHEWKGKHTTYF